MPPSWELMVSCVTLVRCHPPPSASSFCVTCAKGPDELSLHPGEAEHLCCPCSPEQEQRDEAQGVILPRSHRGSGTVTTSPAQ